jgi:4,5-DOPA dioxygenase extradiol
MTLPTLFVSHGAPDLLTSEAPARLFLEGLAASLPQPRFVVMASAHWLTRAPAVDVSTRPATLHDFVGFGVDLERVKYPARGAPEEARRAKELLRAGNLECAERERGLDHGAWVPMALLWPRADVPVFQISLQPGLGAEHHFKLGRLLAPLTQDGGMVIGSGSATHNLSEIGGDDPGFAHEFEAWLVKTAEAGDFEALEDYAKRAPQAARAHPTEDHYLPLLVALGAAGEGARGRALHRSFTYGTLSMATFEFRTPR